MLLSEGTGTPPWSGLSKGWTTRVLTRPSVHEPPLHERGEGEQDTGERGGRGDRQVAPLLRLPPAAVLDEVVPDEVRAGAEERDGREDRPADRPEPRPAAD